MSKLPRLDTTITFLDSDMEGFQHPHDDPYYQRVIMGMLAAFHVRVREGYGGIQPRELGHGLYLQFLP